LKITKVPKVSFLGYFFLGQGYAFILAKKRLGCIFGDFWAIFSQTHPVTLLVTLLKEPFIPIHFFSLPRISGKTLRKKWNEHYWRKGNLTFETFEFC
jgi:hypothetical protein